MRVWLPAEGKPAPVVMFSHGLGGTRDTCSYLGEHWAARGYAVVFVQHPGSDDAVWKDAPLRERMAAMEKAASVANHPRPSPAPFGIVVAQDRLSKPMKTSAVVVLIVLATAVSAQDWVAGSRMPTARCYHGLAFDSVRGRLVLCGGDTRGGSWVGSTWEWDGVCWSAPQVTAAPRAANLLHMAFDSARGETLLYGGYLPNGGGSRETWTWDGVHWSLRQSANAPLAALSYALAADTTRARIVLFGGAPGAGSSFMNETWEWDGTNWQQRLPSTRPSARGDAAMTFDPLRGRIVLFGGDTASGTVLADTWEYDGTNWTPVFLQPAPSPRFASAISYDLRRGKVVLFGGGTNSSSQLADTWEYDGAGWTQRNISGPPAAVGARMSYDTVREETVLFGGHVVPHVPFGDLWAFNGATWTRRHSHVDPLARERTVFAWDPAQSTALLFGGQSGTGRQGDTWVWNGSWQQATPLHSPSPRALAAFATDTFRNRIVVYGGRDGVDFSDTWEWNGSDWLLRSAGINPGGRYGMTMAFDAARNRCVLFGGVLNNTFRDDTWEWNGSTWTLRAVTVRPPAREGHAMAFDVLRSRIVLYGGSPYWTGTPYTDTWEWDGSAWTQQFPATAPGTSHGPNMAWSGDLGRVVLHTDRTWTWDGAQWGQLATTRAVGEWEGGMIADDAGRVVAYASGEVLRLSTVIAAASPMGAGCSGSAGVPVLRGSDRPFLGNHCCRALLGRAAPGAFTILVYGWQPANQALGGGCTSWVANPALLLSAAADAAGTATFALPIPASPALRSVVVHLQSGALDPFGSLGGFATVSNALVLTLGD